jgi:hypothetical protein
MSRKFSKLLLLQGKLLEGAVERILHLTLGQWQLMPNSQRKPQMPVFRYALSCVPGLCTLGKVRPWWLAMRSA